MNLGDWLREMFAGRPKPLDKITEVMGYFIDDQGRKVELHRGPIQNDALSSDQLQRIGRLHDVLVEVYPMTLDGWIDGFRRDADPESEIQIIEACAMVYQVLTSQASLSQEEKKRLYAVLCVISTGGGGSELASSLPQGKGLPDLESIASMYREARQFAGPRSRS